MNRQELSTDVEETAAPGAAIQRERFFMLTPGIMNQLANLKDPAAAMIFLVIAQHANATTRHWDLSVKQIATEAGVSASTVKRAVPLLVKAGMIAVEPTFWVAGEPMTAAEIPARTGGKLVRSAKPSGKDRWDLVRPDRARDTITRTPVGRGFNRYHLLQPRLMSDRSGRRSDRSEGSSHSGLTLRPDRPLIPDKRNQNNNDQSKRGDASPPPGSPRAEDRKPRDLDALVDAFVTGRGGEPSRFLGGPRAQARKAFAASLPEDVTAADITAAVQAARTQPFYQRPGTLTPQAFVAFFPDWEALGRPERMVPAMSAKQIELEETAMRAQELEAAIAAERQAEHDGAAPGVQALLVQIREAHELDVGHRQLLKHHYTRVEREAHVARIRELEAELAQEEARERGDVIEGA